MLLCPCGSSDWTTQFKCPIDPASDRFLCLKCGNIFRRYDRLDQWDAFWSTVEPGTMFLVRSERGTDMLRMMKASDSHHTHGCLFNCDTGTIHHHSEYFVSDQGIDHVRECMVTKG